MSCRVLRLPALLLIASAGFLQAQIIDEGSIVGQLRVSRGSFPGHRIQVTLETRGATINSIYTDDEGKFAFYNLKANLYHIEITDSDYLPVYESISVNPFIMRTNFLNIYLTPKNDGELGSNQALSANSNESRMHGESPHVTPETNVKGANPYLVSSAEYTKHFPKEAVKEFERGGESSHKGKTDDAIRHYKKAIGLAADFYPAHNDLGVAYLQKADFQAARTEFEEVVRANANDASAYFNLANVSLLTQQYDDGLRYVDQGLVKQPNSATGLFIRGCLQRHLGKLKDAERSLRDALQADPSLAMAHLELVNLYRQQERRPEILAELQAFLKLFPTDPRAPQVKSALQKLQAAPQK